MAACGAATGGSGDSDATPADDASDAGVGFDAAGGRDVSSPMEDAEAPDARSKLDVSVDASSVSDASIPRDGSVTADSSTGGDVAAMDGSLPAYDGGDGAPPPYCVAPCIWEAASRCMPILDACTVEDSPTGLGSTRCDPQSGWSVRNDYLGFGNSVFEVSSGSEVCFSAASSMRAGATLYSDERGTIGWSSGNAFVCSRGPLSPTPLPDAGMYTLEPDRPECAAWTSRGYPVGALACISEVPGTCGDAG